MNTPTKYKVDLSDLNHRKKRPAIINRDVNAPGRIYASFPSFVSMTPEEVINLANALVDSLEG
ncbi:hypothetical protein CGLAR1_12580 [Corynebacterium glutamicum]|uniref:hypothetical protein n=1 Tax=Corynebacterium glutamicum TaxID=1718 RepID=UPI0004F69AC1|nr:hypothetical protein [Corynebacterium glutamicum]AIK86037.1 hypothetical protein CGLAR1_12580 [Corynebacterium glutamicum]AIK88820.1 hypothetical protein AR0_12715 [Corynebacterium glutamicum]